MKRKIPEGLERYEHKYIRNAAEFASIFFSDKEEEKAIFINGFLTAAESTVKGVISVLENKQYELNEVIDFLYWTVYKKEREHE